MFASQRPIALVADIGGTNARFALAGEDGDGRIVTAFRHDFVNADMDSLEACVAAYLASVGDAPAPTQAAFGVAAAVEGDTVRLTNRAWSFSQEALKARFGWTRFVVVNDFAAIGHGLADLAPLDWRPLAGPAWPERLPDRVALIGPGTGLGVGAVVRAASEAVVVPTEGGHAGFAPNDDLELAVAAVSIRRFGRVSNERLLSGPGLENLYAAVAETRGLAVDPVAAPQILEAAVQGVDALARDTVERFALMLGSVMGDVALVQGAQAVAIAGGLAPRMIEWLDRPQVRARFEAKGRGQPALAGVPIALIRHPEPGLLGAARRLFPQRISRQAGTPSAGTAVAS